jgi:hypothetical protein
MHVATKKAPLRRGFLLTARRSVGHRRSKGAKYKKPRRGLPTGFGLAVSGGPLPKRRDWTAGIGGRGCPVAINHLVARGRRRFRRPTSIFRGSERATAVLEPRHRGATYAVASGQRKSTSCGATRTWEALVSWPIQGLSLRPGIRTARMTPTVLIAALVLAITSAFAADCTIRLVVGGGVLTTCRSDDGERTTYRTHEAVGGDTITTRATSTRMRPKRTTQTEKTRWSPAPSTPYDDEAR